LLAFAVGRRPVRPGSSAGADNMSGISGSGSGQVPLLAMPGWEPTASSTLV